MTLSVNAIDLSSFKKVPDSFDGSPDHVSLEDGNTHHDRLAYEQEVAANKENAIKQKKAKEEADEAEKDPTGSMKLKRELDAERIKIGVKDDVEANS